MKAAKKTRLTRDQKLAREEIAHREASLKNKQEELQKEAAELDAMRRDMVMKNVTSFGLSTAELDAFVSALDGWPNKIELARAIYNAAATAGTADLGQLNTKLIRLGFT